MATTTDVLRILLTGDSRGLVDAFKSAQGASEKFAVAGRALTMGVTVPLIGVGVAAVNAASDLGEAANKVDVVFGDAADTVKGFARTTTEGFGISERAALEAAGTLGNLVVSMGGTQDAAAEMSVELVGLAGDLASFNNIGTDEALEKLRSGLVGEIEPLRSLGVNFNAATVEAEALAIALADGRTEITEADKVMARYNLILEQTGTAQGDFARTSDSLANQQRVAQASLEDSAAAIGASLLPAVADATGFVADLAGAFADLPAPMQDTIVKFGLIAAAAGPAIFAGTKLVAGLGAVAAAARFAGASAGYYAGRLGTLATSPTAGVIGTVAIALTGLAFAYDKLNDKQQQAARLAEQFRDAIAAGGETAVTEFIRTQSAAEGVTDIIGEHADLWVAYEDAVRGGGQGLDVFVQQLANNDSALQAYSDTLRLTDGNVSDFGLTLALMEDRGDSNRAATVDLAQAVMLLGGALQEGTEDAEALAAAERAQALAASDIKNQQDLAAASMHRSDTATEDLTDSTEDATNAYEAAHDAIGSYMDRLEELQGLTLGVSDAQIGYQEAVLAAAEATYVNGQNLDIATEAGRENQSALNDLARSALDVAQAIDEAGGSQDDYNFALAVGRQSFIDSAVAMGQSTDAANALADSIGLIPNAEVDVRLDGVDSAEYILGVLTRPRTIQIGTTVAPTHAPINERAHGGPVTAGSPYLVGEQGPELFVPGASGRIIPNRARSGGGGTTIVNVNMPPGTNGDDLIAALSRWNRQNGPIPITVTG